MRQYHATLRTWRSVIGYMGVRIPSGVLFASVVQLIEHLLAMQKVVGLNPITRSKCVICTWQRPTPSHISVQSNTMFSDNEHGV